MAMIQCYAIVLVSMSVLTLDKLKQPLCAAGDDLIVLSEHLGWGKRAGCVLEYELTTLDSGRG